MSYGQVNVWHRCDEVSDGFLVTCTTYVVTIHLNKISTNKYFLPAFNQPSVQLYGQCVFSSNINWFNYCEFHTAAI